MLNKVNEKKKAHIILLGPPIGGQHFTKYIYIVFIKFTRQV